MSTIAQSPHNGSMMPVIKSVDFPDGQSPLSWITWNDGKVNYRQWHSTEDDALAHHLCSEAMRQLTNYEGDSYWYREGNQYWYYDDVKQRRYLIMFIE